MTTRLRWRQFSGLVRSRVGDCGGKEGMPINVKWAELLAAAMQKQVGIGV